MNHPAFIAMSKDELNKEHKVLVSVLRSGTKKERLSEAKKQEKEGLKYK